MAADAGSGDKRHTPTWNGNAAKWESFRDEIRVWRLGENLTARLVSALSGPVKMTCMIMDADQLHPHSGDGPVATADERQNIAGLDNVMNVLQSSPLVKKLPARKNELLHALFRDDSLARTKGEPIAMWLVRYNEQLGKLNRVGIDIVTALPDVAGWQALNLAGLTEDRIERVVPLALMTRSHWTRFLLNSTVFASVHMSEPVSSTPAIPPGRAWSSNERERAPRTVRPHHRWGQSTPTFAAERTQNQSASSAQWDTFEEVVDTEDEDNDGSDTIDPGDSQEYVRDELEVLPTCMDNGENDAPIPGVDNSQLETACLKLAELPEALAIVQAARRGVSDQNRHSRGSPGGKGKTRQSFGWQRVPNSARDQRHSLNNAEAQICEQSWTSERHAAFVMRVARPDIGQETLIAQVVLSM